MSKGTITSRKLFFFHRKPFHLLYGKKEDKFKYKNRSKSDNDFLTSFATVNYHGNSIFPLSITFIGIMKLQMSVKNDIMNVAISQLIGKTNLIYDF